MLVNFLVFCSGFCALVYQTVWLRSFRLIFGASTAANAAVLAIFMGGLGLGGLLLSRRADRHPRPLQLYAHLELAIAGASAASLVLLQVIDAIYVSLGGVTVLGAMLATALRLLLSAAVLAVPTICMGATLPAAGRAVQSDDDTGRSNVARLYGLNTLGAVAGCMVSTFVLLPTLGNQRTFLTASLLNALVGVIARRAALSGAAVQPSSTSFAPSHAAAAPSWLVLLAAALVGFAFLLMELVWYRMLSPLFGGAVFCFGVILAVALAGIGLGGAAYAWWGRRAVATVGAFAVTCATEALCIALPFAAGDDIAILAGILKHTQVWGFVGEVGAWTVVTALVVTPAAVVAGFQFPLLIALLGKGASDVGRHVGLAYAANTAGSVVGSLAGGFGLLPALSAPGCWRLVVIVLLMLAVLSLLVGRNRGAGARALWLVGASVAASLTLLQADGPTAAWRHSGIGAGRSSLPEVKERTGLRAWLRRERSIVRWEAEGVESSLALNAFNALNFVVNGKSDGNTRLDAPTQVMGGLIGALFVPEVKDAFVIGLGTGSSAGWLGRIPAIDRVDVVELEPAMVEVARLSAAVNENVLDNPRVHLTFGDAREVLRTTPRTYDIIFSEPSNPYRAGVASLYTADFYRSASARLRERGVFLQWLQAYEVDGATTRNAVATLASVFPSVEIWRTHLFDLMLVASHQPFEHDAETLRARTQKEPLRTALRRAWGAVDVEQVLARFVGADAVARAALEADREYLSTDDLSLVEFGFANAVGKGPVGFFQEVLPVLRAQGQHRPTVRGDVDWQRVDDELVLQHTFAGIQSAIPPDLPAEQKARAEAQIAFLRKDAAAVLRHWRSQPRAPQWPTELNVVGWAMAVTGDAELEQLLPRLDAAAPVEANVMRAMAAMQAGRPDAAVQFFTAVFAAVRTDPWTDVTLLNRTLEAVQDLAEQHAEVAAPLFDALREPFAVHVLDEKRVNAALALATRSEDPARVVEALERFEPHTPWRKDFLETRALWYRAARHPKAELAARELEAFLAEQPGRFLE